MYICIRAYDLCPEIAVWVWIFFLRENGDRMKWLFVDQLNFIESY